MDERRGHERGSEGGDGERFPAANASLPPKYKNHRLHFFHSHLHISKIKRNLIKIEQNAFEIFQVCTIESDGKKIIDME